MPHTVNTFPTFRHPGGARVERGVPEGGEWMAMALAVEAFSLAFAQMVNTAQTAKPGRAGQEFKIATEGGFAPEPTTTDQRREDSATAWGHKKARP